MKKIDVMLVGVTKSLFKTKAILHTGMEFNWISSEILSKLGYDTNALQRKSHGPTTMSISVHYDGFAGIPIREVLFLVASNGNWEVILGQEFITTEGILSRPSSDVSKEMNIPNTPLNPSPGYESKTTTLSNIHVPSVSPSNIKEVEPNIEPHQEIRHDPAPSGSKSPPTSHGSPKYNDEYDISLISFDDDVDQALSGDPWYPLFPPEDQAEQPQLSQFPLPFDEVIEPRQVPKLSKPNLSQQYELLTPPNLDLSLSGIFSRKRDKPLPPIIVEDPNDTVAMKRARNTLAARKSRQRKMQRFEELEEHIAKLESERDHWKEKAIGLPRSQMSSSNPVGPHYALADDVSQQGILQEKVEQNASYTQLLARVDKSDADTVFSTSKDSGYGTTVSSIRPTAPTIKKTTDDSAKWESQSVASVEMSGTMQTMSSVNPAAAGGAAEELAETLIRDELVYSLIVEGYQNFDPDRFERNFNRILERFAHGLKREAGNDLEKSAVRLVYNYRAYVIRVIRKRLALVQDEHATNLDELKTQQASKVALERFLEQIPGAERSSDPIFGNQEDEEDKVQESDPSESEISNDEQPHLRNLENVKLYLTSSRAYTELKQQLLAFVRPSSDITVLEVEDELPTTSTDIENHASEIVGSDMVEALERNPHEFDSQASELCHDSQDSLIIAIVKFLESLLNIDDGNRIDVRASQGREISLIAEKIEQDALLPRKDDLASQGSIIFQSELQSEPEKLQMGDMGTSVLNQQRVIYHDSGTQTELSDDLTRQTKTWNAFANHLPSLSKRLIILHNWWARSMRKPVKQGHTRIEWTCVGLEVLC
jgi:general control protein GCN4